MRGMLVTGLTAAALVSGCGEAPAPGPENARVGHDLQYIVHDTGPPQSNVEFNHSLPLRYQQLSSFTLRTAAGKHVGFTYGDRNYQSAEAATRLYGTAQKDMIDVSEEDPEIDLPAYEQSTGASTGNVKARLTIDSQPSVLFLAGENEFSTHASRNTYVPAAATFTHRTFPKLLDSVSFVTATSSRLTNTTDIATEACQAVLDVETGDGATQPAAQEVVCNSFGVALSWALNGYTYGQYRQSTSSNRNVMGTADKRFIRFLVLPKAGYEQVQHNQSPTDIQGFTPEGSAK